MAVAEIPISGHILGTGTQELRNIRLWQSPPATPLVSPTDGIFWYGSNNGDKRIYFYDSQLPGAVAVPRLDRAEQVTGQWGFVPAAPAAPFTLGANAQGQKVTGLNSDFVDGFDTSATATASTIAVRNGNGRLVVADPAASNECVTLGYLNGVVSALTIDASQITTGLLALNRGGTNADLSGAATGGLIYKGASSLQATGALTGVLIGNGSSAPTADAQLTVAHGGTGASTATGARSNLDVLWADDARGLFNARSPLAGIRCSSSGTGYQITGSSIPRLGTGDFSVGFVFRFSSANSITVYSNSSGNSRFTVNASAVFTLTFISSGGVLTAYTLTPDVALVDGEIYHVFITVNRSGSATLYINGLSDRNHDGTSVTVDVSGSSAVDIGGSGATGAWLSADSPGELFYLSVHNRLLSASDVFRHCKTGRTDYAYQWGNPTALIDSSTNNGGFETAGSPFGTWATSTSGSSSVTRSTSTFHSGAASAQLNVDGANSKAQIQQSGVLTVGKTYRVSLWAKASTAGATLNSDSAVLSFYLVNTFPLTTSWQQFTAEFTADKTYLDFQNGPGDSGLTINIDDVVLTQVGAIFDLDLENAAPSRSSAIKDRSTNANHGTATSAISQLKLQTQINATGLLASGLAANSVLYAGTGGLLTGLLSGITTNRLFLSGQNNGTPAFFDLFGAANTWGGVNTFVGLKISAVVATNSIAYLDGSQQFQFLAPNSGTIKFLTSASSGVPTWTDLYGSSPTWTGNHTFNGTVTVQSPVNDGDAATKAYVDGVASSGLRPLANGACALATTANITLSGEQTIDGTLTSGTRVLVKNQTTASQNGVYITGSGAWTRDTDADTAGELTKGAYVYVSGGTTNAGTSWYETATVTALGTDAVNWIKFFQQAALVAGTGISIVGQTVAINQGFSPTWTGTHTFNNAPVISTLSTNQVLYSNSSSVVTGLAVNSGSVKFLTQASSGAPTWTDLYGSSNAWTGQNTFANSAGVQLLPFSTSTGNTSPLRFYELAANGTNYVGFKAPDSIAADVTWTLPGADGSANYFLKTNGSGVLSFAQIASGNISNSDFVTAVNGTTNRITVTGTLSATIDISASYVGQSSITTLGTITTGTWHGSTIGVAYGGTGVTSWNRGDILYANATGTANLVGLSISGSTDLFLTSNGTTPTWSNYTLPSSISANQLLYASGSTAVSGLPSVASRILATDGSGNIAWANALPAGLTVSGDASSGIAKIKWFDVGDGVNTSFDLTHNYGTNDLVVHGYDASTGREIIVAGTRKDFSTTKNVFTAEFAFTPTSGQFRISIQAKS